MHLDQMFPAKYLKAFDIGNSKQFTIDRVAIEEVGQDRERKPVIYFAGEQKALVLNKTNSSMIAAILRSGDTADWVGKALTLITEPVSYQGRTNPGIRVRAASTPEHVDVDVLGGDQVPF